MVDRSRLRWVWLVAGLMAGAVLLAPATAHVTRSVRHLWNLHIKPKTDNRYLGRTITVVESDTVNAGTFEALVATCPAGRVAVGGGVDPDNVLTVVVTSSAPMVGGDRTVTLSNGRHGPATAWWGAVRNNGTSATPFKVAAICARAP